MAEQRGVKIIEKKKCGIFKFGIWGAFIGILLFLINLLNLAFIKSFVDFLLSPAFLLYDITILLLTKIFVDVIAVILFYFSFLIIEGFIVGILIGWVNCKIRKWTQK